ncbi:max dimerization protein 3 isoform X2 [Aquila chrysaetos chrysaetos]|uniref:max dimerization protein 3 isoform X2 n=1 Tax=Aquila chrysaetos chrysaetos TaxID=223781 RepID=UPI0011771ADC|nr:max dimerization protein 3 isoform X2 [Aquila chrysaetos chrysaetos]
MEPAVTSIQVLLQAAEFLERRERGAVGPRYPPCLAEAEHGYASLCPARSRRAVGSVRRAQLRCCLERLKQQVPVGAGPARSTTLSLLHRARLHIQRLEEQELRAQRAKDRLRNRQRSLRQRLERLLSPTGGERARANSLDSSQLSEPSEGEDAEIEVDGAVFSGDLLPSFCTGRDHSYSSPRSPAS